MKRIQWTRVKGRNQLTRKTMESSLYTLACRAFVVFILSSGGKRRFARASSLYTAQRSGQKTAKKALLPKFYESMNCFQFLSTNRKNVLTQYYYSRIRLFVVQS